MLFNVSLAVVISSLLICVNFILSPMYQETREKTSSFECGFDPAFPSRLPFSLRFFLIAVIFLIFDVEITLILPAPILFSLEPSTFLSFMMTIFIIILIVGLGHEWENGALEWKL